MVRSDSYTIYIQLFPKPCLSMSKKNKVSDKIKDDAMKVAAGTQKPGQTKEQTRLIAQGIQKGIAQYKKQQSIKTRELDKKLKKSDYW